ncbi:hypothetical protein N656DRAFT_423648 [Canariomyces notabilis]|uniref:Uncharacterized protein n=1 Tax=Canariomyces notabilis TaxID=2074819 RepID=A0AAN6QE38_9PEZI|nr:hypothetical protein N656DRAFT_423648 [Canariomyces arenarius]
MQFTTAFLAAVLAFATGTHAAPAPAPEPWTKDANGVWVANDNWWDVNYHGDTIRAHESCTWQGQPVAREAGTRCTYWTNSNGGQYHGSKHFFLTTNIPTSRETETDIHRLPVHPERGQEADVLCRLQLTLDGRKSTQARESDVLESCGT